MAGQHLQFNHGKTVFRFKIALGLFIDFSVYYQSIVKNKKRFDDLERFFIIII